MFEVFFFDSLRVLLDAVSGRVVAVQDRLSGADASFSHSPQAIDAARAQAVLAFGSLCDA